MNLLNFSLIIFSVILQVVVAYDLKSVRVSYDPLNKRYMYQSFDADEFACVNFPKLCTRFLDGIGCTDSNRVSVGCYNGTIASFVGACKCTGDPVYQDKGARIQKQIIDNRIKNEIGWMLEPWEKGPPYSVNASCK